MSVECECGHGRWAHASDLGCLVASQGDGPYDDNCQQYQPRRSALVTCPHDWSERGGPGDEWRECWLCGEVADQ